MSPRARARASREDGLGDETSGGATAAAAAAAALGPDLAELLGDHSLVVCCGSGGVGKTTVSAALAMGIVERYDKRVMVLTVDPARRLASALGLTTMGLDPVSVSAARLKRAGIKPRGELVAAMLDQKSAWDRMVEQHAPTRRSADRILANPFYKGISDAFVGSHEYIAMEALHELWRGGEYDVVVVDTPPSRNALDFLDAPTRMGDFVGGRLLSWLAGPSRVGWRALNFAATPFVRMADRLIGAEMLEDLAAFVNEIQVLQAGVQERARAVYRLFRSEESAFAVVTTLEPQPFAEAEYFCERLRDYAMPLRALVVNRTLPSVLLDPAGLSAAEGLVEHARARAGWLGEVGGERVSAEAVRHAGEAWLALARLAARDERQVSRLRGLGGVPVARLPLSAHDVSDVAGLAELTAGLRGRVAGVGATS